MRSDTHMIMHAYAHIHRCAEAPRMRWAVDLQIQDRYNSRGPQTVSAWLTASVLDVPVMQDGLYMLLNACRPWNNMSAVSSCTLTECPARDAVQRRVGNARQPAPSTVIK